MERKIVDNMEFTSYTHTAKVHGNFSNEAISQQPSQVLPDRICEQLSTLPMGKVKIENAQLVKELSSSTLFNADEDISVNLSRNDYTERPPSGYPADIAAQSNIATVAALSLANPALNSDANTNHGESNLAVGVNTAIPSNLIPQEQEGQPTSHSVLEADEYDDESQSEDGEGEESEQESECGLSKQTSFSDLYVIDEHEEARLKKIALDRYMREEQAQRQKDEDELIYLKAKLKREESELDQMKMRLEESLTALEPIKTNQNHPATKQLAKNQPQTLEMARGQAKSR